MPISTWIVKNKCKDKNCDGDVQYLPVKLLLEVRNADLNNDDVNNRRIVTLFCNGDINGVVHKNSYIFPDDFKKL